MIAEDECLKPIPFASRGQAWVTTADSWFNCIKDLAPCAQSWTAAERHGLDAVSEMQRGGMLDN